MRLKELIGEQWFEKLKGFLVSPYFKKIQEGLAEEMQKDLTLVVPSVDYVFEPFKLCPLESLKVIILNDLPYKDLKVNDGMAFSTCDKVVGYHNLEGEKFFDGIEEEMYEGLRIEKKTNAAYLAEQGVLLLNACPTYSYHNGEWKDHAELWERFTSYLINKLSQDFTGMVFILVGKDVRKYAKLILPTQNYLLTCSHPRDAKHFAMSWDSGGVFEVTNMILKLNNNTEIKW